MKDPAAANDVGSRLRAGAARGLLLAAVTALALFVLVRGLAGTERLVAAARAARWRLLPLPLGLATLNLLASPVRWGFVLEAMGHRIRYRDRLRAVLALWPLAVVTPSRANDLFRVAMLDGRVPLLAGVSSGVAEKLIDVNSLLCLTTAGAAAHGLWVWSAVAAGFLALGWAGAALAVRHRGLLARLPLLRRRPEQAERLGAAFAGLRARPRCLAAAAATSLAMWLVTLSMFASLLRMAGSPVGWVDVVTLWPLAVLAGGLPVTIAGMGTRDAAFVYLLAATGVAGAAGAGARAAVLFATLGYSLVGTWLYAAVGVPVLLRELMRPRESGVQQR